MKRIKINPGHILAKQKIQKKRKPFNRKEVAAAATELGHLGGLAGGPARAEALSSDRRTEIARHAANLRWGNECLPGCTDCLNM